MIVDPPAELGAVPEMSPVELSTSIQLGSSLDSCWPFENDKVDSTFREQLKSNECENATLGSIERVTASKLSIT